MSIITIIKNFVTPIGDCTFEEMLNRIKNGYYATAINPIRNLIEEGKRKEADALKAKLVAFTASGRVDGKRNNDNIKDYAKQLVIDYDKVAQDRMYELKTKICQCPFTQACFKSPSGQGFKVFVRVDSDAAHHREAFIQVQKVYEQFTNAKIDASGKDISRLCFVSYDPQLYYQPNAAIFPVNLAPDFGTETPQPTIIRKTMASETTSLSSNNPSQSVTEGTTGVNVNTPPLHNVTPQTQHSSRILETYQSCIDFVNRTLTFIQGSRHNFVFKLAIMLRYKGITEDLARIMIVQDYNFDEKDVLNCIKSAYGYVWKNQSPRQHPSYPIPDPDQYTSASGISNDPNLEYHWSPDDPLPEYPGDPDDFYPKDIEKAADSLPVYHRNPNDSIAGDHGKPGDSYPVYPGDPEDFYPKNAENMNDQHSEIQESTNDPHTDYPVNPNNPNTEDYRNAKDQHSEDAGNAPDTLQGDSGKPNDLHIQNTVDPNNSQSNDPAYANDPNTDYPVNPNDPNTEDHRNVTDQHPEYPLEHHDPQQSGSPEDDPPSEDNLKKTGKTPPRYTLRIVEWLLKCWFQFRYNLITRRIEYRRSDSKEEFLELTDREENSIFCSLHHAKQYIPINTLHSLLNSRFIPDFNPFEDYFSKLAVWDGITDYIGQLSNTLKTKDDEHWTVCICKWIVAFVASLLNWDIINHTVIVLVGGQGVGKTTWMKNLLPEELKSYLAISLLGPDLKDNSISVTNNALIILDEMETLNKRDLSSLKELITRPSIKIRRPFERSAENLPHMASFIAGVNFLQVLSDPSGTRRYLCFDTLSINYDHDVDINGVMAQALALYKSGFRYWFNQNEIKELEYHNSVFVSKSVEEEWLDTWFRPVTEEDWKTRHQSVTGRNIMLLSSAEIAEKIMEKTKIMLSDGTLVKIGKVMSKLGFTRVRRGNGFAYKVRILDEQAVENSKHYTDEESHPGLDHSSGEAGTGLQSGDDGLIARYGQQDPVERKRRDDELFSSLDTDPLPF